MNDIWIVDAFTQEPYKGNPAAVMIVADFFSDTMCQSIAAEMNLSETAFVKVLDNNRFHIRWFTPTVEVKLCGHATLAAAHILYQNQYATVDHIALDSLSGPLKVQRLENALVLDFPLQKTGKTLDPTLFEKALKLREPVVEVVEAYDDIIVVLENESSVANLEPDFVALAAVEARGIIVTAASQKYDFVSRFFAPRVGVNEDPVTGSAHCKLADYWSVKLGKHNLCAYQASARGGKIDLEIVKDRVLLKGNAVTVMKGQWQIPL